VVLAVTLMLVGAASASALKLCVPKTGGAELVTPKHGKCRRNYKLTSLGAEGKQGKSGPEGKTGAEGKSPTASLSTTELATLQMILPHLTFVGTGVAGKPTVEFTGVNVQLVNGAGKTASRNGEGNLVIGYDENPGEQIGSHDLMLGVGQTFTSFGEIIAGVNNTVTGGFSSVVGGASNLVSGEGSAVGGGVENKVTGGLSSVSGGAENQVAGETSSISGGIKNTVLSDAGGGSITGGKFNVVNGIASTIAGGEENEAIASFAAVDGGTENLANGEFAWIGGGGGNIASGKLSAIFGGKQAHATKEFETLP
jgi:hypothetical protein